MPFINGQRVTVAEWNAAKAKPRDNFVASDEETDAILGKPTPRQRRKIVKSAAAAATGVVIADEDEATE